MDAAWYRAAGSAFAVFAAAAALMLFWCCMRRMREDRRLRKRARESAPEVGRACSLTVTASGHKRYPKGKEIPVPYEGTLGSAASCDVSLLPGRLHARSAFFWMEADGLHIAPLHRDGLTADGQALLPGEEGILTDGAEIACSGLRLRLHIAGGGAAAPAAEPYVTKKRRLKAVSEHADGLGAQPKRLRVPRGAMKREKERLESARDRRLLISRRTDGDIVLCALLTALVEAFGLLLGLVRPGAAPSQAVPWLSLAVVAAGLLSTLLLPRLLTLDATLMALVNFLCGAGLVLLYTVSPGYGERQMAYYLLGLCFMLLLSFLVRTLRHPGLMSAAAIGLGVGLLALPLLFGEWINGAKNWIELPVVGSFQPSELVKLCLILVLAWYMSAHRTLTQMMPAILFAGAAMLLLMLQRDLGTALIYYLTTLALFYAACGNLPLTALGLAGGAAGAALGYRMFAHVRVRVAMWRNPWIDPTGSGYQIIQALLAIGSGGLFGVGLGQGAPEKIPEYYNDFIFAVACEQLGQVFGVLLLGCYVLLLLRGTMLATRQRRSFGLLLGTGVVAALGIQTFMIVAGVVKLLPLTGVTMPFMSYGGSSMLACFGMIGILHGLSGSERGTLLMELFPGEGKEAGA